MANEAGEAYHAFIREQLDEERSTKTSLEQRGVFVITSSGTLGTLLFGFAAFALGPDSLVVSDCARLYLQAAAMLFVVAAILGIAANWPRSYEEALPEELRKIVDDEKAWRAPISEGHQVVAEAQTQILAAARRINRQKAGFLTAAMLAQVLATVGIAAALMAVLSNS